MNNYNLLFISTHQDSFVIHKLIESVERNNTTLKVLLLIISQECKLSIISKSPATKVVLLDEVKMGLSKARNIGLKYLKDNFISGDYIMFPDDDSSFDSVFFENFESILDSKKNYITPIFNNGSRNLYKGKLLNEHEVINADKHSVIRSPNQIILYNQNKDNIYFNESLGVGALFGSCEDYDLFIRLNRSNENFYFTSKLYSFHPSKSEKNNASVKEIINRYKSYSPGFVFIIKKYKKYKFIPLFLFRPIGGFLKSLFKFNFKMSRVYSVIFIYRLRLLMKNTNLKWK